MRVVLKITGIFFLWFAGFVMVAHSIVPHHHEEPGKKHDPCTCHCKHENSHQHSSENTKQNADYQFHLVSECENPENPVRNCSLCHYNSEEIKITSTVSIDSPFISGNTLLTTPNRGETDKYSNPLLNSYKYLLALYKQSRAPPVV